MRADQLKLLTFLSLTVMVLTCCTMAGIGDEKADAAQTLDIQIEPAVIGNTYTINLGDTINIIGGFGTYQWPNYWFGESNLLTITDNTVSSLGMTPTEWYATYSGWNGNTMTNISEITTTWSDTYTSAQVTKVTWTPLSTGTFGVTVAHKGITETFNITINGNQVTYSPNGGSGSSVVTDVSTSTALISKPSTWTAPANKVFAGWSTSSSASPGSSSVKAVGSTVTVTSDVTYYAVWETPTYTLTYSANGGSGTVSSQTCSLGSSVSVKSGGSLYRSNYEFDNWNTRANGTGTDYSYRNSISLTSNTTLYAQWTYVPTIAFSSTSVQVVDYGQSFNYTITSSASGATYSVTPTSTLSSLGLTASGSSVYGTISQSTPGTYYLTITASANGYTTNSMTLAIYIKAYVIDPPSEAYTGPWSYTPDVRPAGANVTSLSVVNSNTGSAVSGFSVSGGTISGNWTAPGSYTVSYRVTASGVESSNESMTIVVSNAPVTVTPITCSSVSATLRSGTLGCTYDFVAVGASDYATILWNFGDGITDGSSTTVVHTYKQSGVYTVTCTLSKAEVSDVVKTVSVNVIAEITSTDKVHAWKGDLWSYAQSGVAVAPVADASNTATWVSAQIVDGYCVFTGTPTATGSYLLSYGSGAYTWTITVHEKQTSEPVADFELSSAGMTVIIETASTNASYQLVDWGEGDGFVLLETTTANNVYEAAGTYSITLKAVNNIGPRTSVDQVVLTGEVTQVSIGNLEDSYQLLVGTKWTIDLVIPVETMIQISGGGDWLFTEGVNGSTLVGIPEVSAIYNVTVSAVKGSETIVSKVVTFNVYGEDGEAPAPVEETPVWKQPWMLVSVLVVLLIALGAFVYTKQSQGRSKAKTGKVKAKPLPRVPKAKRKLTRLPVNRIRNGGHRR